MPIYNNRGNITYGMQPFKKSPNARKRKQHRLLGNVERSRRPTFQVEIGSKPFKIIRSGSALIEFALAWMKDAGMSVAMVETGGDPGHERSRHTYEKVGFELFPVARYFKKLGSADVKSQSLLCSRGAIALVPILRLSMIRLGSASSKQQSRIGAVIAT